MAGWGNVLRRAARVGLDLLTKGTTRDAPRDAGRAPSPRPPSTPARSASPSARNTSTAERARRVVYAPQPDGAADPGEIVWTWVPYEENDGRGKDRPVLVVGREGADLLGLMLSSQSDRAGDRDWISVGTGGWDREGRESFVRLDRVIEVGEHDIRREGAVLDRKRFDRVADQLRSGFGWS